MVIGVGSFISTFFLSLRQYPSTAMTSLYGTQILRQRSRTRRIVSTHPPQFDRVPLRGVVRLPPELLFLTEILGAEVIDVRQHRTGAVRDLTVRVQEPYPIVTGLVVSRRGELVIPWSEVRTFAAATREVALRSTREDIERHV